MCHTDVSIVLFCSIKPEPLFYFIVSGDEENSTRSSNKNPNHPVGSKQNFKVSLLVFLPRRKEESEICSEIHATEWNAEKSPTANINKGAEMWKEEKIQTKTIFKIYYIEWWLILPKINSKGCFCSCCPTSGSLPSFK